MVLDLALVDEKGLEKLTIYESKRLAHKSDESVLRQIAADFLRNVISGEYINTVFFPQSKIVRLYKEDRIFFCADNIQNNQSHWSGSMLAFASRIFQLRNCAGIDHKIQEIVNGKGIAVYAELELASMLQDIGGDVFFNVEIGEKGQDFDILCKFKKSQFNIEVKHKLSSTALTRETMRNSLKKIHKQFPKEGNNLAAIRIPGEWVYDDKIQTIFRESSMQFHNSTSRTGAIMVFWQETLKVPNSEKHGLMYKTKFLTKPKDSPAFEELISMMENVPVKMSRFQEIIKTTLRSCRL